jgi:muramidase (phage lysozyme)
MLGSSMFAMASGGIVPASRTISQSGTTPGQVVAKEIVRSFTAMLDNRSSEIFQNIRKELELQVPGGQVPGQPVGPGDENLSGYGTPEQRALLKAISFAEGTERGYGIIFGGANVPELERGELTISQVLEMQKTGIVKGRTAGYKKDKYNSDATGKYQFMSYTLREEAENQGVSLNEKFTPEMQDRLILGRITRFRGVTPELLKREGLSARVASMLAPEFASFPTLLGGSYYGQPSKKLSSIQQVYKQSLSSGKLNFSGSDPISFGKSLLKMGFTVAENRFFTKFKGFNPLGSSYVGEHSNSADHAEHSLDITDWKGDEREGIERLKALYKSMFSRRKQLGIDELIFDPVGQWFEGMQTHSAPGNFGHPKHVHVRFKTPASRARFRRDSGPLISSNQTSEQMNLSGAKPLTIASSPQQQRLQQISNIASRITTNIEKETQILIQPIIT